MLKTENGKLLFQYDAETMIIEAWGRDSLRVRSTKLPQLPENDWALISPKQNPAANVEVFEGHAVIQNGKIKAIVNKGGKVTF